MLTKTGGLIAVWKLLSLEWFPNHVLNAEHEWTNDPILLPSHISTAFDQRLVCQYSMSHVTLDIINP